MLSNLIVIYNPSHIPLFPNNHPLKQDLQIFSLMVDLLGIRVSLHYVQWCKRKTLHLGGLIFIQPALKLHHAIHWCDLTIHLQHLF
jgi:hypothetical protein